MCFKILKVCKYSVIVKYLKSKVKVTLKVKRKYLYLINYISILFNKK